MFTPSLLVQKRIEHYYTSTVSDQNVQFAGSIPEFYDQHLGPVLFEPYAKDLAQRIARLASRGTVLETACGTGILTAHLRKVLPNATRLIATDLNQAMIDIACSKAHMPSNIEWKQADACTLPFSNRTFSTVVNEFGMMFIPEKSAAIQEAKRVLMKGGLFAFSVWDSVEHNHFGRTAHEIVTSFFDSDPPMFYQIPFGFHDPDLWINLLRKNGFNNPEAHLVSFEARSDSAESFATGIVRGNPVSLAIQDRGLSFDSIVSAVRDALIQIGGDHPFRSPMQAYVFIAGA